MKLPLTRTYRDPHFCFHVHTNDEKVFAFLESYLSFRHTEQQFNPFFEFHYFITYHDRNTLKRADKAVYHVARTGEHLLHARVSEQVSDVMLEIDARTIHANLYSFDNEMGVMDFTFLQPCRTVLAHQGWLYVHGAHVQSQTHDIVITGPSGAGKSTIGHVLGEHPAFVHQSDDEVFIASDGKHNRCVPFPTKIGFKNAALQHGLQSKQEASSIYGNKQRFALNVAPQHFYDVKPRPTLVIKPRYDAAAKALELTPLDKDTMVREIADFSFPMLNLSAWPRQSHLAFFALVLFMQRAEVYTLTYNDALLAQLPDFLSVGALKHAA